MFNPELEARLALLAQTRTQDGYRERQDELVRNLPGSHAELVDLAYDCEESALRIEALELVAIVAKDDYKTVLSDSARADPDPAVKDHAQGLLFRAIVNEQIEKQSSGNRH